MESADRERKLEELERQMQRESRQRAASWAMMAALIACELFLALAVYFNGLLSENLLVPCGLALVLLDGILGIFLFHEERGRHTAFFKILAAGSACLACLGVGGWISAAPAHFGVKVQQPEYVVVLCSPERTEVASLEGCRVGFLKNISRSASDQAIDRLKEQLSGFTLQEYTSFEQLENGLLNGEVQALIVNERYLDEFENAQGFNCLLREKIEQIGSRR